MWERESGCNSKQGRARFDKRAVGSCSPRGSGFQTNRGPRRSRMRIQGLNNTGGLKRLSTLVVWVVLTFSLSVLRCEIALEQAFGVPFFP